MNIMARVKIKDLPKDLKVTREEMKMIMGGGLHLYGKPPAGRRGGLAGYGGSGGPVYIISYPPVAPGGPLAIVASPPTAGGPIYILAVPPHK